MDAKIVRDGLVHQPPEIAVGAQGRPRQGLEVEEERLLHDLDRRQALGDLADDDRGHLDRSRLHGADGLMVVVELAAVKDLDAQRSPSLLFHLLLEEDNAAAHDDIGGRDLQAHPEGYGLNVSPRRQR